MTQDIQWQLSEVVSDLRPEKQTQDTAFAEAREWAIIMIVPGTGTGGKLQSPA